MLKTFSSILLAAALLSGCVVYPGRPAYIRAPVVIR
jgi:PBP1b-binding outer membrane lipoprotein LpoB